MNSRRAFSNQDKKISMTRQRSTSAAGYVSLEVGDPFNPFRLFNGIFIPEALVRESGISVGAKVTYGRL
jgi:hypothetical protein